MMNLKKSVFLFLIPVYLFLFTFEAYAQPRAYIPNRDAGTVSVVDTSTNMVVDTIAVGSEPNSVVVTPDGTKVYISRGTMNGQVTVIQSSDNSVLTNIPVGINPSDIAITPDGSFVYVTNFNSFTVSKIDTSTDTVVDTLNVPFTNQSCNPRGIVDHPTLGFLYVISICDVLYTIDTSDDSFLPGANRTALTGANDLDITPDGAKLYVTDRVNASVQIINLTAGVPPATVSNTVSLSNGFCEANPQDVAVDPDGDTAWVLTQTQNSMSGGCNFQPIPFNGVSYVLIDTNTDASVLIGGNLQNFFNLGFTRDGMSFYAINFGGGGFAKEIQAQLPIVIPMEQIDLDDGATARSPYFIGPDMSDLTVEKSGNGAGTVTSTPAGIDCGTDCTAVFPTDSDVDLSAVPDTGSEFTMWDQDCSGTNPDTTITLMTTSVCEAIFSLEQFNVNVNLAGTGSGTVTSNPAGINCPGTCSDMFDFGSNITLTESANADSDFIGWTGDPECTGGVINNLTADVTCIATFDLKMFTLTANKAGNGTGTVTSAPPGINCGPACGSENSDFVINTNVTLTAAPTAADSEFAGWGGDCAAAGNNLNASVTMDQARTCTANFALQQRTLTVDKTGTGDGTVTSAPPGINCGAGCTTENADFIINTMVTLTAAADGISSFSGWGGACAAAGTNASATVNMTDAMTCSADFTLEERTLTVNKSGNGDGTVTSNPAGINCGPGCTTDNAIYIINTMVTLTATPDGIQISQAGMEHVPRQEPARQQP